MSRRLLVVCHAATRTGAPILLLNFLRWLKTNTDFSFEIVVTGSGPLVSQFAELAPTHVRDPHTFAQRVLRRLLGVERWNRIDDWTFRRRMRRRRFDLAYVNTVCPVRQIKVMAALGCPVLCHVHELDYAVKVMVGYRNLADALPHVRHFVAASGAVRDYLTGRWAVPASKITLVHEFVTTTPNAGSESGGRAKMRAELRLGPDEILVGGCGALDWRKGSDLFLHVARLVQAHPCGGKIRFLWVGANKDEMDYLNFEHDVLACGLQSRLTVIEKVPNPRDYFAAMDIFALTSREDPFPLVMLEAASLGLPMVCFESSGGGPEFAETDAGVKVPYLDTVAFAEQLVSLAGNPETRSALGRKAQAKLEGRYTLECQAPKLADVLVNALARPA